jgi:DNA-binding NarL/FixJ family response regulator
MLPEQTLEATDMKRKHMNHIQDIIRRLQQGESERRIARDLQIARGTVRKYSKIAKEKGYLGKTEAQHSPARVS